jgi:hypothetical protein
MAEKEAQFRSQIQHHPSVEIIDEEELKLSMVATISEGVKEFVRLEEQEAILHEMPERLSKSKKHCDAILLEMKGIENQIAYLNSRAEAIQHTFNNVLVIPKKDQLMAQLSGIELEKMKLSKVLGETTCRWTEAVRKHRLLLQEGNKLKHIKQRMELLFNRIFLRPDSQFIDEINLRAELERCEFQIEQLVQRLESLENQKDFLMKIAREFSVESSVIEQFPQGRVVARRNLVSRIKQMYENARKNVYPDLPVYFPPLQVEGNPNTLVGEIVQDSCDLTAEEIKAATVEQHLILSRMSQDLLAMKEENAQLLKKKFELSGQIDAERRRILREFQLKIDRRVVREEIQTPPDIPPSYDNLLPPYCSSDEDETENQPLQLLVSGKKKRPKRHIPLISQIPPSPPVEDTLPLGFR